MICLEIIAFVSSSKIMENREEEEVMIHLTSLHQGEEEADYCHPSQEGVVVEAAFPSQEVEEYKPTAVDTACRITVSDPQSLPAPQHS